MKQTISILYVAVLIVMGAATFVESAHGTPYAHAHIYGTWWFAALWAALAAAGAIYIIRYIRATPTPSRLLQMAGLHLSFIVILAGALLTHLYGRSGTIHLRIDEPQCIAEIEHNGERYMHRLNFSVTLTQFEIINDADGNPIDYRSCFEITSLEKRGKEKGERRKDKGQTTNLKPQTPCEVSMNNIFKHGHIRFYQMSYDRDQRGSTLMLNRDPWGIPVTYCGYALLFVSFISLLLRHSRHSIISRRVFYAVPLTAAWCVYYFILDGSWAHIPVLRSPLLFVHVIVIIMAYALLLIQAVRSAIWLAKGRNQTLTAHNDGTATGGLKAALCLLSIGIFLGAIWANISWGNYWSWDSKEVWALITLMVYAVPLHRQSLPVFRQPKPFHLYMIVAFLSVLMTYYGVNYLLTGLHSYN